MSKPKKYVKFNSDQLFLERDDVLKTAKISLSFFYNRIYDGDVLFFKNGKQLMVFNTEADFVAKWDALPALLSYQDVCDFLCVKRLSGKVVEKIGFYAVAGEDGLFTDKLSLGTFLMRELNDEVKLG